MAPSTTPSQTVGPFFQFLVRPGEERIVAPDHPEAIRLEGRVTDGEGAPVPDAMIELWQADAAGRYAHPEDPRHDECDPSFTGFARAGTDAEGRYRFVTVRPGAVAAPGGGRQAPHIAMSVFARGLVDRVTTRVYLPNHDDVLAADAVLARVDEERRSTLVAIVSPHDPGRLLFDIRLQGDGETVFFDV
ncbi:MAG: protocatechuate 3,4-dioxygenase subunit alpha [Acidimicrobiales bacterium]